jgi:sulfide:quinone oxidoreductase
VERQRRCHGDAMPGSSPTPVSDPHASGPTPRVLIAGAGIAALEAALALRSHLGPDRLTITLLSPNDRVFYPPLAVVQPFVDDEPWSLPLATFAKDVQADHHHGVLAAVDAERRIARTSDAEELPFSALLVATGAHPDPALEGVVPFRGPQDAPVISELLDQVAEAGGGTLAFVAPGSARWSLPIYELALMTSAHLRSRGVAARCVVVTAEEDPLHVFPPDARRDAVEQLNRHQIELITDAVPVRFADGGLQLAGDGVLHADHVVALPVLHPHPIEGLDGDAEGFLPVDDHCRVVARSGVYAAGDVTAGLIKQGGLACQQADAAAAAIVADLGHPIEAAPYRPVLRGLLLSDEQPQAIRASLEPHGEGSRVPSEPRVRPHAWPHGKIVGHHLSPYLMGLTDGPRTPDRAVDVARSGRKRPS